MPKVVPIRRTRTTTPTLVHQVLVVLHGSTPLVWRRIQVPTTYSFWDLHVAIQDAMGWHDTHLHEFRVLDAESRNTLTIGIKDEDSPSTLAGWTVPLADVFTRGRLHTPSMCYAYDFGDGWVHTVIHEGQWPATRGTKYPRLLDGQSQCPPEDCGGIYAFAELVEAMANPTHPRRQELLDWLGAPFGPHAFDASAVTFDNPKRRWRRAFER